MNPADIIKRLRAHSGIPAVLREEAASLIENQHALLSRWRAVGKGLNFGQHSGEVADYDDELASELVRLHRETVAATEFPQ